MLTTTPLTITAVDAQNINFTARSTLSLQRELLLKIPTSDYSVYSIEVATNVSSRNGRFISATELRASCCIIQTVRVVTPGEIIVPSFGNVVYPQCQSMENDNQCNGISTEPSFFNP